MNAQPNLDRMIEAPRRTREGRLAVAMAMIQGALGAVSITDKSTEGPHGRAANVSEPLDMNTPVPGSGVTA